MINTRHTSEAVMTVLQLLIVGQRLQAHSLLAGDQACSAIHMADEKEKENVKEKLRW